MQVPIEHALEVLCCLPKCPCMARISDIAADCGLTTDEVMLALHDLSEDYCLHRIRGTVGIEPHDWKRAQHDGQIYWNAREYNKV